MDGSEGIFNFGLAEIIKQSLKDSNFQLDPSERVTLHLEFPPNFSHLPALLSSTSLETLLLSILSLPPRTLTLLTATQGSLLLDFLLIGGRKGKNTVSWILDKFSTFKKKFFEGDKWVYKLQQENPLYGLIVQYNTAKITHTQPVLPTTHEHLLPFLHPELSGNVIPISLETELLELEGKLKQLKFCKEVKRSLIEQDLRKAKDTYKQLHEAYPSFTMDEMMSLTMYTATSVYPVLNTALALNDQDVLRCLAVMVGSLLSALGKLPPYQGKVYRGVAVKNDLDISSTVMFPAFTSSSTNAGVSDHFKSSDGTTYIIEALSPRSISPFSVFKVEEEYLFGSLSVFKVTDVQISQGGGQVVYLKEYQNPVMFKVVLWVDDQPDNNTQIIKEARNNGIVIVKKKTTQEALDYIEEHLYVLSRPPTGFRIITDLSREENGQVVTDAGVRFIQQVRKLNYSEKILLYTERKKIEQAIQLVNQENLNVHVTCEDYKTNAYAHFILDI